MPLLTLDQVSLAFGYLPLFEDASLRIEPGERLALIGRNGTGKSTLLKVITGELPPDGGTVWQAPGLSVARLSQDAGELGDRTVREEVAAGLRPRVRRPVDRGAQDRRGALPAVAAWRPPGPGTVRRLAAAGAPRKGARLGARPPAARRAHQPSRHRRDPVARRPPARLRGRAAVRDARSRLPAPPGHAHHRARSRHPHVVAGKLRRVRAQEDGGARDRGARSRTARQEARGGRGVAAPGHQSPPHAQRGARPRSHGTCGRSVPRIARSRAPCG